MNHTYIDMELEVFDEGDDVFTGESMIHLWPNKKGRVSFCIGNDCELQEQDDGYGRTVYSIQKKETKE